MKNKRKFNHAMDIAFEVSGSDYEDWADCLEKEKEKVMHAMWERLITVFQSNEYLEAIGGFDTHEEEAVEDDSFNDDVTSDLNEREMLTEKNRRC